MKTLLTGPRPFLDVNHKLKDVLWVIRRTLKKIATQNLGLRSVVAQSDAALRIGREITMGEKEGLKIEKKGDAEVAQVEADIVKLKNEAAQVRPRPP